jgi:PAS domain S-box-containing protein
VTSRIASNTGEEVQALREQADRLARSMDRLRIASDMSARLMQVQGIGDLAARFATLTSEATNASNTLVYFLTDGEFEFADARGHARSVHVIDNEMARTAFESGQASELPGVTERSTWAIPLEAGDRIVGALVTEEGETNLGEAEEDLGIFFRHASLLLASDVRRAQELARAREDCRLAAHAPTEPPEHAEQPPLGDDELRVAIRDLQATVGLRTRAFKMLSRVNETLMQAYDERELLQNVCDTVVDAGGYALCWVGFVQHDAAQTVLPVASAGPGADYVDHINVSWGTNDRGRGPTGRSIRRRKPVAARDLRTDRTFAPWRNAAASRGYRSSASFPLIDSKAEVFGALSIYSSQAGSFDDDEMQLLAELARNLAFGIGALRERRARAEADRQVRESARYARSLVEANVSPLVLITPDGKIGDVNRATEDATGLLRDQLIGTDFAEYFTNPEAAREGYQRVLQEGEVRDYPLVLKHVSGSVMYVEYNASVYRGVTGELQGVFAAARDVTERRRAQAQEARLAAIVTSSQDAIFSEDLNCAVGSWNEAAERLYGYSAEEMIGANAAILAPPDRIGEPQALLDRVCGGGEVTDFETVRRRKDGTLFDISLTLSPLRDDSGEITSIAAVGRDISERKRAERERAARLRFVESMDRINLAIQGTNDLDQMMSDVLDVVLSLLDCDRAYLLYPCDPTALTLTVPMERFRDGYPGAEALGLEIPVSAENARMMQLLLDADGPLRSGPDSAAPLPQEVADRFGVKSVMAVAVRPKSGKPWEFGVQQCSAAREWTDDEVELVREVGRRLADALSIMLARRELQQSEVAYRRLIETAAEGICQLDADSVVVFANARMAEMLGRTVDELVGSGLSDLIAADEIPDHHERMVRRRQGLAEEYERRFKHSDGHTVWAHVSATPVFDEDGGYVGSFGMFTDITQSKEAEVERLAHLHFVESMDRVNRAIQGADDLNQMMRDVLDVVLSVFGSDRAFLMHPCNPNSPVWSVPMERFRPEYPGVEALGLEIPMDSDVARTLEVLLAADGPVRFGPGTEHPLPEDVSERFGFRSFMSVALRPRLGEPWQFGLHQCSYAREWTDEEVDLLREIGRRLEDALTSMIAHHDLERSEAEYRRLIETATEGVWMLASDSTTTLVNTSMAGMLGYSVAEMLGRPATDFIHADESPVGGNQWMEALEGGRAGRFELLLRAKDGGTVWASVSATPVLDDAGLPTGSFAMVTDTTERKQAEEALKRRNEELERFERVVVGRELRMKELKERIAQLEAALAEDGERSRHEPAS